MVTGFHPLDLLPEATLNRTVIPDGLGLSADLVGATGAELLAGAVLAAMPRGDALGETSSRVAALVAALIAGDPDTGLGVEPSPWRRSYLRHWHQVQQVYVGGGSAEGLGQALSEGVEAALLEIGIKHVSVRIPDRPSLMPLIGAARAGPPMGASAVLDFGQGGVKKAIAHYDASGLVEMRVLPTTKVDTSLTGEAVTAFVLDNIEDTLREEETVKHVAISVAGYVLDGRVSDLRSFYAALGDDDGFAIGSLARGRFGSEQRLTLIHDGTAAGWAVASEVPTGVIVMGSWLGVGFAPPPVAAVPISPRFRWT